MSVTVKTRIPPLPPPKPKTYFIQNSNDPANHCRSINTQNKKLGLSQGDSDTDSGICADSDNQPSPGRNRYYEHEFFGGDHSCSALPVEYNVKQGNSGIMNAAKREVYKPNVTAEAQILRQHRLPQRSVLNGNANSNCRLSRVGKHFRVRFADQVVPASESSTYASDDQDSRMISGCPNDRLPINADTFEKNLLETKQHLFGSNGCNERVGVMPFENNDDTLPPPPNYGGYFGTLREPDPKRYSRQQVPAHSGRYHPNRSSSLPRAMFDASSDERWICADFTKHPMNIEFTMQQPDSISGTYMRGVPNHMLSDNQPNFRPNGSRILPKAPVTTNMSRSRIRQPAFSRQRRVKQAQIQHRSHSVGPSNWRGYDDHPEMFDFLSHRDSTPSVRAKLIALDHRGFRTVVIEKLKPGPFGFYIATGVINQRRGIFISRVSLPSLMPILSVGDELIFVENEMIKGRTLEYVQSLIAEDSSRIQLPTLYTESQLYIRYKPELHKYHSAPLFGK